MNIRCQIFTVVAFIYSSYSVLAIESDHCDCDILQVKSEGLIGNRNVVEYQSFTKQTAKRNGKPIYFSKQKSYIYWNNQAWSHEKYNAHLKKFEPVSTYGKTLFNFGILCKNVFKQTARNPR